MTELIHHPVVASLAWALVHFLWQGAAIAAGALILMRLAARPTSSSSSSSSSSGTRYAIGIGAMAAMVAAPVATFIMLVGSAGPVASSAAALGDAGRPILAGRADVPGAIGSIGAALPSAMTTEMLVLILLAWSAGVLFFATRLLGGWLVARQMARRHVRPAAVRLQTLAGEVARRLALRRAVTVFESTALVVPVVVGWLRPVVILPVAAIAGLSPAQIEALVAHELAHVRRHDYLVNILQSVVEVVLFYHPAVWWMSRRVRIERELCCDDLAVSVCDRLVYVTALNDLATLASPRLALAATDGDLLSRVRRLLGPADEKPGVRAGVIPAFALVLVTVLAVPATRAFSRQDQAAAPTEVTPAQAAISATEPIDEIHTHAVEPPSLQSEGLRLVARGQVSARSEPGYPLEITVGGATLTMNGAMLTLRETQQSDAGQKAEQARREVEIAAARRQLEEARAKFDKGLVSEKEVLAAELALVKLQARLDPALAQSEELAALRRLVEDARARVEIGTMAPRELAELQTVLEQRRSVQSQDRVALELELARRQLDRTKALFERGLIATRDLERAKLEVAEVEEQLRTRERTQERTVEEASRQVQAQAERLKRGAEQAMAEAERLRAEAGPDPDQTLPIVAGDILSVIIAGEPDLPTVYTVKPDGTIRLPLLGSFRVIGQTATEVRAAVGKQLADRKLGSAAQVQVVLKRAGRVR